MNRAGHRPLGTLENTLKQSCLREAGSRDAEWRIDGGKHSLALAHEPPQYPKKHDQRRGHPPRTDALARHPCAFHRDTRPSTHGVCGALGPGNHDLHSGRQVPGLQERISCQMRRPSERRASSAGSRTTWCTGTAASCLDGCSGAPPAPSAPPRGSPTGSA